METNKVGQMLEFTFLFKLEPAGDFGLPEQHTTVTRPGGEIYTDAIDSRTLNIVSHGTLSQYREKNEAITFDEVILGLRITVRDNFLWIALSKESYKEAEAIVLGMVDGFVQLVAVNRGIYFRAEFLQAMVKADAREEIARQPKKVLLGKIKTYSLPEFKESLRWAFEMISLPKDQRLATALDHFSHAQFLSRMREDLPLGYIRAHIYLAADIFSNYYRATSAIVGDPSKDRDYQSRYKKIGLNEDAWQKIERVRHLRNDFGVAHYELSDKIEQLEQEFNMAVQVTREVIMRYVDSLQRKAQSEAGSGNGGGERRTDDTVPSS